MVVSRVQAETNDSAPSDRQGAAQPSASPQANSPAAKLAAYPLGAGLGGSKPSLDRQGSTAAAGSHAAGGEPVERKKAVATAQSPAIGLGNNKKLPVNKDTSSATSQPRQPAGLAANEQKAVSTGISMQSEGSARPAATKAPPRALPHPTESPQPKDSERAAAPARASAQPGKLLQPAGSGGVTVEVGAAPSADATALSLPAPLPSPSLGPVSGLGGSNLLARRHKPARKQQASSQPSGGASASLVDSKPASSGQASDPVIVRPARASSMDEDDMPLMQRILARKQSSNVAAAEPSAVRSETDKMQARQAIPASDPALAGAPFSCPAVQVPLPSGQPGGVTQPEEGTALGAWTPVAAVSKPAPSPQGRPPGSRGRGRGRRPATAGGRGAKRAEAPNLKRALTAAAADRAATAEAGAGRGCSVGAQPPRKRKRVLATAARAAAVTVTGGGAKNFGASGESAEARRREAAWALPAAAAVRPVRDAVSDPSTVPAVRCLRRDEELGTGDELVEEIYSEEVWEMLQAELKAELKDKALSRELILLPVPAQLHSHDSAAWSKARDDIQRYLALDANGKRDYMKRRMEVFVITDPKHPAKKHQANILQFLDVRTQERGVKAKEDLAAFTLLGEYVGVVRTGAAVEAEAAACPLGLGGLLQDKLKTFSHSEPDGRLFGLWTDNKDLVVDAARAGNMLRFVNDFDGFRDGVVNNATMIEIFDFATLRPHTFFFTVADIRAGQEILLDYGDGYRKHMQSEILRAKSLVASRKEAAKAKAACKRKDKKIADLEAALEAAVQATEKGTKAKSKPVAADKATKLTIKQLQERLEEGEKQRKELKRKLRGAKDEASRAETALAEEQAARAAAEEATAQVRRQLEAANEQAATIGAAALAVAENDESKVAQIAELEASKAEILKELEEAMRKCKQLEVSLTRVKEQNAKADDANRNLQKQLKESRISVNQAKSQRDEARAEVERLKTCSKLEVGKLNQYVDKVNHYKSSCTRMEADIEALRGQLRETQEKSGEEIARLSNVAKGLERDKELLEVQLKLLMHHCKELDASHGHGPGSASLAALLERAFGQSHDTVEQHAQPQLPSPQLPPPAGMPLAPAQVAATAAAAGPQLLPLAASNALVPRPVQDPRRRPPTAAAAAPAAAREERDPFLAMFQDAAQAPPSAAAAAPPAADGSSGAFLARHPSARCIPQPHGSAVAAAPADANTALDHALPGLSGQQPGSAAALERGSSAPSQGVAKAPGHARSRMAVVGFPAGTPIAMDRTCSIADVNSLNDSPRQAETVDRPSPPAGLEVPPELPPHLAQAIKKEIEDGQHKASGAGGGSPEAPAAAANAEIPFTESQLSAFEAILLERFKARGFLPAAHSTPEPQKHEEEAVAQKEVSPPPGQDPAIPEEERARQCQQPSSERETTSVEDTAKVTGAAPAAPAPAEPAAVADNRAEAVAAAAVPAAESGADETSVRRDSECPEARERGPGARDRGARHREGSWRWEDRARDLNQRKECSGDRQVTPPRHDTRDRHRSKHRSRSHDRGRSRDRTRHRVSSNRSRSRECHHRSRDRDLDSDRNCARNRKRDHDRHRGRHPQRDREIDPSHGRHQALDNDRVREWDRPKLAAAAIVQRSHPTLAIEECKKRKAPSRWEPHAAHSPTRAPSPTTEVNGSKRRRTDSPQPQRAHTPSAAAAADDRSGQVLSWLNRWRAASPMPEETAAALAAAAAAAATSAAAAGGMSPAADPDGASSSMSMSPPPLHGGPAMAFRNPVSPANAGGAVAVDGGNRRRLPSPAPSANRYRSFEGRLGSDNMKRRGWSAREPCIHCKKMSHPSYRCWYKPSNGSQVAVGQRPLMPRRSSLGERSRAKRGINWASGGQAPH
ncbi:g2264 [Coccomyxa elongata]